MLTMPGLPCQALLLPWRCVWLQPEHADDALKLRADYLSDGVPLSA
jgi:hypothetical protein